jgi:23S rRNA (pseudouridine1915-N3)-methyltransferase
LWLHSSTKRELLPGGSVVLQFLFVGGDKEAWLRAFEHEYEAKLSRHYRTEISRMKPSRDDRSRAGLKKNTESDLFAAKFKAGDFVVLFDERGDDLSSVQFSKKMEAWLSRGKSRLVFCVGGAFGFNDELRTRADAVVSLSSFVMNHHVAQAVVLEQVYRAISIQKNLPYHNE